MYTWIKSKLSDRENRMTYLSAIILVVFFIVFALINLFHTKGNLFADATQTSIGARVFWEYHSINPNNWFAWTESGIFTLSLIGAVIYGTTGSLLFAQSITPVIITIFITLCTWFLLKAMKFSNKEAIIGLFFVYCIPWGVYPHTMSFLFYAAYSLTILTAFWQLAVYLRMISGVKRFRLLFIIVSIILAFAQGSNSSRATLVVYVPLMLVDSIRYLIYVFQTKKIWHKERAIVWLCCFGIAATNYIATFMPWAIHTPMSKALRKSVSKFISQIIPAMLDWMGLDSSTNLGIKCIIILLLLVSFIVVIKSFRHLDVDNVKQMAIAYFLCTICLTIFMLAITKTDVTQRYFFMIPYFIAFSVLIFLCENKEKRKSVTSFLYLAVVFYAVLNIWINFMPILIAEDSSDEKEQIINWMLENDYFYGYADYLDANPLTVYADGKVQVSSLNLSNMEVHRWVTDPKWYCPILPNEMKTVYIVRNDLYNSFAVLSGEIDRTLKREFNTKNYIIYSSSYNHSRLDEKQYD